MWREVKTLRYCQQQTQGKSLCWPNFKIFCDEDGTGGNSNVFMGLVAKSWFSTIPSNGSIKYRLFLCTFIGGLFRHFDGLALATKQHIFFRNSTHFETLRNTTDVVLDKTGTISSGHSTVTKLHWWQAAYPELALTLTSHSNRQISKIFQQHLASKSLQLIPLNNWMEMADSVLRAAWENQLVSVGNHRWMEKNGVSFTSNEQN